MRGRKLNNDQRQALVDAFLVSRRKAYDLAKQYGVSRTYPALLAASRGLQSRAPYIQKGRQKRFHNSSDDPRWQWAKERGEVTA